MKITALTSFCVDHFPDSNTFKIGGNSLNFITNCKICKEYDLYAIGGLGNDRYADAIEKHLDKLNINRERIYRINSPTASNKIYIASNGDRYFKEDSWNGGAFDDFRLSNEDWEFSLASDIIAMPAGDPNLTELLKRRTKYQLIAVDFLDYLPIDFIQKHISNIDITFLSAKEEQLNGLELLSKKTGKLIVATLGADGSIAFNKNKVYKQEAIKVNKVVDTTGCGDAFQAAFTIEWFKSQNIKSSLEKGAIAASKVTQFTGGVQ